MTIKAYYKKGHEVRHVESRHHLLAKMTKSVCDEGESVLCLGGGADATLPGELRKLGLMPVNVDIAENEKVDLHFDLETYPYPVEVTGQKWKVVTICDVLEHLWDPEFVLDYVRRFCEYLLVSVPNAEKFSSRDIDYFSSPSEKEHIRWFRPLSLMTRLMQYGFQLRGEIMGTRPEVNRRREIMILKERFPDETSEYWAEELLGRMFPLDCAGVAMLFKNEAPVDKLPPEPRRGMT